jgi:hypothetical protein
VTGGLYWYIQICTIIHALFIRNRLLQYNLCVYIWLHDLGDINMNKQRYHLINYHTDAIIFDGWFASFKRCVEHAIADGVCLDGVDLAGQDMQCANMDDAQMVGAHCQGANFNGANLSEAVFDNANFAQCDLTNACFAVSSLMNINFIGASFGDTDCTDAIIRHCQFSCPTMFNISWRRAASFSECLFVDDEYGPIKMDGVPIVVQGLPRDIVFLDDVVRIGYHYIAKSDIQNTGMAHLKYLYGCEIASHLYPALRAKEYGLDVKKPLQDGMSVL